MLLYKGLQYDRGFPSSAQGEVWHCALGLRHTMRVAYSYEYRLAYCAGALVLASKPVPIKRAASSRS